MSSKDPTYHVQVIDRSLNLLDALYSEARPMSLVELSRRLDLPKSTTMRLLMVLQRHRLVEKHAETGEYRLGLKLFELGSAAVAQLDLADLAGQHLRELVSSTGETAYLSVLDGNEALTLERVDSAQAVRVPATLGRRSPLHCTAIGKVLLAYLPANRLMGVLGSARLKAYTPKTITSLARLREELRRVRERGFAVDDEEIEEGVKCIAAPVKDHLGRVAATLGILGPVFRIADGAIEPLARTVIGIANRLSADLGYKELPSVVKARQVAGRAR